MSKVLWMVGQATAIGLLTWNGIAAGAPPEQAGALLIGNTIVVAFLTAVLVNLWGWLRRPRALATAGHVDEPKRKSLSLAAPSWFLGQLPQKSL